MTIWVLQVYSAGRLFRRRKLIGEFQMDVATVYHQPGMYAWWSSVVEIARFRCRTLLFRKMGATGRSERTLITAERICFMQYRYRSTF